MPASRPNILFIVVDDCGYADLGCTGQSDYQTPSLDRLAGEGIRFTQAYANSALCTNTRVALITGRYQYRLPIGRVEPLRWSDREAPEMGVPPGFPTLPALLRGAGYRTALIGKWHLGYLPRYSPLKSGYEEFFGVMGGFTGYYTHIGDGGERDLYEGETPVERATVRERGDLSKKQPDLRAELRALWEDWDRDMLPLPTEAVVPVSNLSAMLW
jgi:arylsulfatase A-like enzyme